MLPTTGCSTCAAYTAKPKLDEVYHGCSTCRRNVIISARGFRARNIENENKAKVTQHDGQLPDEEWMFRLVRTVLSKKHAKTICVLYISTVCRPGYSVVTTETVHKICDLRKCRKTMWDRGAADHGAPTSRQASVVATRTVPCFSSSARSIKKTDTEKEGESLTAKKRNKQKYFRWTRHWRRPGRTRNSIRN